MALRTAMSSLSWSRQRDAAALVFTLSGRLDEAGAARLLPEIEAGTTGGARRVLLDCAALSGADAPALGPLLRAHSLLRAAGGQLIFAAPSPELRRVLSLTRLARLFLLSPSLDEALLLPD